MKVAVFLRGHKRNWDLIKHISIPFFEKLGDTVHYYISVWDVDKVDTDSIELDFPKNRLKAFIKNKNHFDYGACTGPIYQSRIMSQHKYQNELAEGKYDLVLDTRFDVLYHSFDQDAYRKEIFDYLHRLGSTAIFPDHNVGTDDHLFLMDSKTEIFWNSRNIVSILNDNTHKSFYEFAVHYDLNPYTIKWFSAIISRPNLVLLTKEDINEQNLDKIKYLIHCWNDSNIVSKSEKLKIISLIKGSPEEYYFQLENCS
jgi:hypothetical protein